MLRDIINIEGMDREDYPSEADLERIYMAINMLNEVFNTYKVFPVEGDSPGFTTMLENGQEFSFRLDTIDEENLKKETKKAKEKMI